MSSSEYRYVALRVCEDNELIDLVKQLIKQLSEDGNADLELSVDGSAATVDDFLSIPQFNTVEFSFEFYKHQTFEFYKMLVERIGARGTGFGALEGLISGFNTEIGVWGHVQETDIDLDRCDDTWSSEVQPAIDVTLDAAELCSILGCEPDELEELFEDESETILSKLFDEELTEELFLGEPEPDELDLSNQDEPVSGTARLTLLPEESPFIDATIDELKAYKASFERAAAALKEHGGTITLRVDDSAEDADSATVVLLSSDGFKKLGFRSGPNYWGEFEAISYELS